MGRVKLKLKTVESRTGRIVTYSKRKNALLKKANELAVLCGIDVVLLMFSPTGKVALQMGEAAKFDQIIRRFASTSAEERVRSKMEVFETLKKSYKNSDHEVQAKYFSGTRPRSVEDLIARSNLLQEQLAETQQRLSDWRNPDKIEDVELLGNMEDYLGGLFDQINSQKMNFSKKEIVEVESSYENQINLTSSAGVEIQSLGSSCDNIAHTPNQNFHVNRPLMGTPSTAANISRLENAVIDNSRDYASNLLHSELLRNEVAAFRSEAWRNEFERSEFLINAYKGAGYSTYDITKGGISGNRFFEAEIKNNEFFMADNSSVQLQRQNPCPQQSIIPPNQQNMDQIQQQNIYMVQQQNIVPIQQQVPCPLQNMDNSFDDGNLEAPSSSYDPILEWSGSFDALDFSLLDSQQPLSINDYEHTDQLKFQIELP